NQSRVNSLRIPSSPRMLLQNLPSIKGASELAPVVVRDRRSIREGILSWTMDTPNAKRLRRGHSGSQRSILLNQESSIPLCIALPAAIVKTYIFDATLTDR